MPITNSPLPITHYQLPITNYQLPITNYQLPITMIDLFLILAVGFLGSFGHCLGMCGPLAAGFSLSQTSETKPNWQQQFYFHCLLNLGRIVSYSLVGALLGAIGEVTIAGGELAGIGSGLRRGIAIFTGLLLIWFGLLQIKPELMPKMPDFHPFSADSLHNRLSQIMIKLGRKPGQLTPLLLGFLWGFIPCGFLYAAQIKAAQTGSWQMGCATLLVFGLGTSPSLIGLGIFTSKLSANRRSQLFRMAGWITLTIGMLTLLRSDAMIDYTGHAALILLTIALIARPISRFWDAPLRYRRALGVGAFILSIAHLFHMIDHTLNWNFQALFFLLPQHQIGMWAGIISLGLIIPLALTSFDRAVTYLGKYWRQLHLLSIPALILAVIHAIMAGSHYLGDLQLSTTNQLRALFLALIAAIVLLLRFRLVWSILSLEKFYVPPTNSR